MLVVEPSADLRDLVMHLLQRHGLEATALASHEVPEHAWPERVDVVVVGGRLFDSVVARAIVAAVRAREALREAPIVALVSTLRNQHLPALGVAAIIDVVSIPETLAHAIIQCCARRCASVATG